MTQRFKDKVAVVTGAAQSIGLACAAAFAREGAQVVIADLNLEKAEAAAGSLQAEGLAALALPLDVREPEQAQRVVSEAVNRFGHLDVWLNNAGVAHHYDSFDLPRDLWQSSLDVLLSGAFYGCQAAGRVMRDQGGGAIVNMASVNGLVSQPRRAAYCTAKAGLIMLTRVLAAEWAAHNIRVNAVAPSPVATSGMAAMHEVTDAVLFLASDAASFVTGETLCVDGGWVAYGYL
jgi:NAD(P)-dependent dehydrogenase (short-subunit alcohol dehydrogenase family)